MFEKKITILSNEIKSGAQRPFKHHGEKACASACDHEKMRRCLASMAVSGCHCFRDSGSSCFCACSLRLQLSVTGHHVMASTCSPLFCLVEQEGQVCSSLFHGFLLHLLCRSPADSFRRQDFVGQRISAVQIAGIGCRRA